MREASGSEMVRSGRAVANRIVRVTGMGGGEARGGMEGGAGMGGKGGVGGFSMGGGGVLKWWWWDGDGGLRWVFVCLVWEWISNWSLELGAYGWIGWDGLPRRVRGG